MSRSSQDHHLYIKCVEFAHQMLHTRRSANGSGEEDFLSFHHIWAWRPSWSCDLDQMNKILINFAWRLHMEFN